jgi:hypothetical protein
MKLTESGKSIKAGDQSKNVPCSTKPGPFAAKKKKSFSATREISLDRKIRYALV